MDVAAGKRALASQKINCSRKILQFTIIDYEAERTATFPNRS
jgi:hypothetical protein